MRSIVVRLVGLGAVPAFVALPFAAVAQDGAPDAPVAPAAPTTAAPTSTTSVVVTAPPPSPGSSSTAPETTGVTVPGSTVDVVPGPLSDGGDAHVVAQGIVDFADGSFGWTVEPLNVTAAPFEFDEATGAFLVNSGDSPLIAGIADEAAALLDAGEAAFVAAGQSGQLTGSAEGAFAAAQRVSLAPSTEAFSFAPGPGRRDVNLVGAVLRPGDTLHVVSPFPVLVVVTSGAVLDAPEGTEVVAGTAQRFNDADLSNAGAVDARVFVAAVGSPVP
ncbi:hypothetical protein [Desertimonas flava]|uniref:hypothetical protein n=1 Tax=Desertimonas flava TaxID=2064846 RepID=UPI0013C49928|nr:hypothetical protein [Desertimonas flava]